MSAVAGGKPSEAWYAAGSAVERSREALEVASNAVGRRLG